MLLNNESRVMSTLRESDIAVTPNPHAAAIAGKVNRRCVLTLRDELHQAWHRRMMVPGEMPSGTT